VAYVLRCLPIVFTANPARRLLDEVRDASQLFLTHFEQGISETADTVSLEKRLTSAMRWRHVHTGERLELSVTDIL
jgi:hypothetical protein